MSEMTPPKNATPVAHLPERASDAFSNDGAAAAISKPSDISSPKPYQASAPKDARDHFYRRLRQGKVGGRAADGRIPSLFRRNLREPLHV